MRIFNVSGNSIPLKEYNHQFRLVLQPIRISVSNHAVIGVEKPQAPTNFLYQPIVCHPLVLHCHGQLFPDDIVHNHVEYFQRNYDSLSCSKCGWEGRPIISILYWHHLLVRPESLLDSAHAMSCAISLQGFDYVVPVRGVVVITDVKED